MKPKTEELLYFLLWSCEMLARPTFRNLTDSFESWAYRNGFHRQLAELERQQLLEAQPPTAKLTTPTDRVLRLTEAGRLHALGGRDPESRWRREWDGHWRLVLFDLPLGQDSARDRLRLYLRKQGFGYLQQSVWISPDPLQGEKDILAGSKADVESLLLLEARPSAGETDEEIVAGAWDFPEINRRYARHLQVLAEWPDGALREPAAAQSFRKWAARERAAWLAAVAEDPLLPEVLLPQDYLGRKAWQSRIKVLHRAAQQMRHFQR
jgi:phenylacetic acid degradation operon negative regulatory protein